MARYRSDVGPPLTGFYRYTSQPRWLTYDRQQLINAFMSIRSPVQGRCSRDWPNHPATHSVARHSLSLSLSVRLSSRSVGQPPLRSGTIRKPRAGRFAVRGCRERDASIGDRSPAKSTLRVEHGTRIERSVSSRDGKLSTRSVLLVRKRAGAWIIYLVCALMYDSLCIRSYNINCGRPI